MHPSACCSSQPLVSCPTLPILCPAAPHVRAPSPRQVREILAFGTADHVGARVELEEFAMQVGALLFMCHARSHVGQSGLERAVPAVSHLVDLHRRVVRGFATDLQESLIAIACPCARR